MKKTLKSGRKQLSLQADAPPSTNTQGGHSQGRPQHAADLTQQGTYALRELLPQQIKDNKIINKQKADRREIWKNTRDCSQH